MRSIVQHARRLVFSRYVLVPAVVAVCFMPDYSYAGWLSWLGVGLTVGAIAAGVFAFLGGGGPAAAAALVLGVGQVVAIVADVVFVPILSRPPPMPPMAMMPQPPPYVPTDPTYPNAVYPPVPTQGNSGDPIRTAGNNLINAANSLLADARAGAPVATIDAGARRLGDAYAGVADSIAAAGLAFPISQADIASAQAGGIPSAETDYLVSAGISAANIAGLNTYFSTTPFNLSGTTSVDGVLRATASALNVSEPASFALMAAGLLGVGALRLRRR